MCMRKRIWTICKILMVWCVTLCLLLEQKGAEVFAEAQELYAGTEVEGVQGLYSDAEADGTQGLNVNTETGGIQELHATTAPAETQLYAKAAVLMDAASGRVLYEKNGQEILPMASTTKIMTCIVALESADSEMPIEISNYAANMPKVKMYVKEGETYYLEDMLYSLMLESHNDVAVAIAENIGKQFLDKELREKSVADYTKEESMLAVAAFADLMNEKAASLGCENTWFITPNGLDATETFRSGETDNAMAEGKQSTEGVEAGSASTDSGAGEYTKQHSTTAEELAIIMSYCVLHSPQKDKFLEITQTPSYTVTSTEGRNSFCSNHNAFLNMMEGAISGKTGFTNLAGYCYVGAVEHNGNTYVVALLACGWPNNKSYKWSDMKKLVQYGIEEYAYREFEEASEYLTLPDRVLVRNGQTAYIGQRAYVPVAVVSGEDEGETDGLLMRADENVVINYRMAEVLDAPVYKGDIIGVITYEVDGQIYKQEDIVVMADMPEIDWKWCVEKVLQGYLP